MEVIPIWSSGKTFLPALHFEAFPELAALTIREGLNWDISLEDTFVSTYWSKSRNDRRRGWDPRGSRALHNRFRTYKFLPAMGLGGEVAWNAGSRDLGYDILEETLRLFNQRKGRLLDEERAHPFDLSAQVNRDLADTGPGDGVGFIDQGRMMDRGSFPTGRQVLGGVPFLIADNQQQARAISVRSIDTPTLPGKVRITLAPDRYTSLVFLHTCHLDFEVKEMHRNLDVQYVVTFEDGSTREIQLVNDENIMAWAPALTRFDAANGALWLAWTGMTQDNLPSAVFGYHWENPLPRKEIRSVDLEAGGDAGATVFLIALTGIVTPDVE